MKKTIDIVRILKWFFPLPGLVLYRGTVTAFGPVPALVLGIAASVWFWIILRNGVSQLISQGIVREIARAISAFGNLDHMIEIRKIHEGVIARVYLIGSGRSIDPIRKSVTEHLRRSDLRQYLWVMQMVQMKSPADLSKTRMLLNRELLDAIRNHEEGE